MRSVQCVKKKEDTEQIAARKWQGNVQNASSSILRGGIMERAECECV